MMLWELLATTEDRVMSWSDTEWPALGQDLRAIYWATDQGHAATAVFDRDFRVRALELTQAPQYHWVDQEHRQAFAESLQAGAMGPYLEPGLILTAFLERMR